MDGNIQAPIRIRAGQTNLYLFTIQDGLLLVDAGTKGSLKRLEQGLASHRFHLEDIRLIVITHTHYDHVGGLREIVDRTRARVLVHAAESDFLCRGFTPFPRGTGLLSKGISLLGRSLLRKTGRYAPVFPDIVIDKSLDLGPYGIQGRIVPTPGHTAGSVSILLEDFALVGDTLFHVPPWRIYPPFADDEPALAASWQKLLETDCRIFYPAHGAPISREFFNRRAKGEGQRAKGIGQRAEGIEHRAESRGRKAEKG